MAFIGQDVDTVFLGLSGAGANNLISFYGVLATGGVQQIYNSSSRLPDGAFQGGVLDNTAVQVGDALYFVEFFRFGLGGAFDDRYFVSRLNKDGTVETLAQLPGGTISQGAGPYDHRDTAFEHNGTYHVMAGSALTTEVFSVSPAGVLAQITDFDRPLYPGAQPGAVWVNDTLFVLGDQRTPSGISELWRVAANGGQEAVFSDGVNSVLDVDSFANRAWFITSDQSPLGASGKLFSIGENGSARRVALPRNEVAMFLDTDADGLLVVTRNTAGFLSTISSIAADGSVTRVMSAGFASISDICGFGSEAYFIGIKPLENSFALYRVGQSGDAELVRGIGNGLADPNVAELYVSGGKLWFTANIQVRDGFGGFTEIANVLHSMDSSGQIAIEAGAPGTYPNIIPLEGYEFALDFPDPINGTSGADLLLGTGQGELISGLAQDDTVQGFAGNDTIVGGLGADLLLGDRGQDLILGEAGNDTLGGGLGTDVLTGNVGADTFRFDTAPNGALNADTITDFASGIDHIELALSVMAELGSLGVLDADAFRSGAQAVKGQDASDRVIFNTSTGALYYDSDGSGAARSIKIAVLGPLAALDFSDIVVI